MHTHTIELEVSPGSHSYTLGHRHGEAERTEEGRKQINYRHDRVPGKMLVVVLLVNADKKWRRGRHFYTSSKQSSPQTPPTVVTSRTLSKTGYYTGMINKYGYAQKNINTFLPHSAWPPPSKIPVVQTQGPKEAELGIACVIISQLHSPLCLNHINWGSGFRMHFVSALALASRISTLPLAFLSKALNMYDTASIRR